MSAPAPAQRTLTFRSGGWVIALAGVLALALLAWATAGMFRGYRPIGGGDLASYRFDLSHALVPTEELIPSGHPRDFITPLQAPPKTIPGTGALDFNARHKRYLVSNDRVLGVTIGDERRAYPISVLQTHEFVEDVLGGVPILVTYSPLCDAAAVYDRRVGEETLSFGLSGLLRNANTLYFDRRGEEEETASSLWQQIDGRAITGPAAARGERLRPAGTFSLARWADWLAAHPEATVILRDEGRVRLYRNTSYERSHARPEIGFPVAPLPPEDSWPPKRRVLLIESSEGRRFVALEDVAAFGEAGWSIELPEGALRIRAEKAHNTWLAEGDALPAVRVLPGFWFAFYAGLDARDEERMLGHDGM